MSQIRIIEEFITRLAYDLGVDVDSVFPADLFDLIAGVGFGGYIYSSDKLLVRRY